MVECVYVMLMRLNKCVTVSSYMSLLPHWQLPSALSPRWQFGWSSDRRCPPPWCNPVGPAGRWKTTRSGYSSAGSSSCPRTPLSSSAAHWYRVAGRRRGRFGPSPPGWDSSPSSGSVNLKLAEKWAWYPLEVTAQKREFASLKSCGEGMRSAVIWL